MRVDRETSGIMLRLASLFLLALAPETLEVAVTSGMKKVPPMENSVPLDFPSSAGLVKAFSEPKKAAVPVPPIARDCGPRPIRTSPLVAKAWLTKPVAARAMRSLLIFM